MDLGRKSMKTCRNNSINFKSKPPIYFENDLNGVSSMAVEKKAQKTQERKKNLPPLDLLLPLPNSFK